MNEKGVLPRKVGASFASGSPSFKSTMGGHKLGLQLKENIVTSDAPINIVTPRLVNSIGEDLLEIITEQIDEYVVNITDKIKTDKNYRERANTLFRERGGSLDSETFNSQEMRERENSFHENPELPFCKTVPKKRLKKSKGGGELIIGKSKFGVVPPPKSRLIPSPTHESTSETEEEVIPMEVFDTGYKKLDGILNNSFKSELFTNYLRSKHSEALLEIYIDIYRCKANRERELDEDYEPFIKATIIGISVVKIFQKYLTHDSLSWIIKEILRELAFPFITSTDEYPSSRSRSNSCEEEDDDDDDDEDCNDFKSSSSNKRCSEEFIGEIFDDDEFINSLAEALEDREIGQAKKKDSRLIVAWKIVDGSIFTVVEEKVSEILFEHLDKFIEDNDNYRSLSKSQCRLNKLLQNHASVMDSKDFIFCPDDPFEIPDSEENIQFLPDSNNVIEYATVQKLVQRITHRNAIAINGSDFQTSFILTYRYFSSTEEIIQLLKARLHYITLPPINLTDSNLIDWKQTQLLPTVIRIMAITKLLVETHLEYFRRETAQKEIVLNFVSEDIRAVMSSAAQNLIDYINKKIAIRERVNFSDFQYDKKPPKPKLKKKYIGKPLTFSMMHIIELARQMTLLDFRLFRSIRVEECLHMNWTRKNKEKDSPNVLAFIRQFCNISLWVVHTILLKRDVEKRAKVLSKMILLADANLKLNNFNGAMAVFCGLRNHSIIRLKNTWELLPKNSWDIWESLENIFKCDANFANLRTRLQDSSLPAIPYLGLFLSDLTFIDNEENFHPNYPTLANFSKMQFIGSIMNQIQKYQTFVYCLEEVESLQQYLNSLKPPDENELYKISMTRESRNGQILRKSKRRIKTRPRS